MDVAILRGDIEVAEHDKMLMRFEFGPQELVQRRKPAQLVRVFFRANALSVWNIQIHHSDAVDCRRQDTSLRIFETREILHCIAGCVTACDGDPIVGFLTAGD